ncbi:hypothetical protein Cabys_317 [Caldithrix abyssi DSM 13497]|uniref:Uncharacterized protein n=1 Tax=Caldithrix abyssi DSM 13497 TaxID=880073 RepID=A0A1J1C3U2_CALAY|nr:hypothetical protein Cabys_317 [Caldithrix abyssi DSM 13497]
MHDPPFYFFNFKTLNLLVSLLQFKSFMARYLVFKSKKMMVKIFSIIPENVK